MNKTANKFSPEVRRSAVRMVLDSERDYSSRGAAISLVAGKIDCSACTLLDRIKKAEVVSDMRAIILPN